LKNNQSARGACRFALSGLKCYGVGFEFPGRCPGLCRSSLSGSAVVLAASAAGSHSAVLAEAGQRQAGSQWTLLLQDLPVPCPFKPRQGARSLRRHGAPSADPVKVMSIGSSVPQGACPPLRVQTGAASEWTLLLQDLPASPPQAPSGRTALQPRPQGRGRRRIASHTFLSSVPSRQPQRGV
jgi:hypothetical protein